MKDQHIFIVSIGQILLETPVDSIRVTYKNCEMVLDHVIDSGGSR
jgi:hypothetical protein